MNTDFLLHSVNSNRISIKRAIARFCYNKKINICQDDFKKLVRYTQDNGYEKGVNFLYNFLYREGINIPDIQKLLYSFTIEYNMEMIYFRMFPMGNKNVHNIVFGKSNNEDKEFFNKVLYDIVKANILQKKIIEKYC